MLPVQIQLQVQLAYTAQCFLATRLCKSIPAHSSGRGQLNELQRLSNKQLEMPKKPVAAPKRAPKSKAAPTNNEATQAANNTHAASEDSLLPQTIYHNGKGRLERCGVFTHDPVSKKRISSLKGMIPTPGKMLEMHARMWCSRMEQPEQKSLT